MLHRATPIKEGERSVVLSMTYCTDPRNTVVQGIVRRIKDTAGSLLFVNSDGANSARRRLTLALWTYAEFEHKIPRS